ncbi:heme-binding protein [Candidatus Uabimicrobium amorphum]|uniref:Heme-binding protein n=2 Tax=Uabimicrobium amorphum TaxID=2596890 RepID=A0A5S9IR40_UABAM|nr:heme-binding protein [Candidatus Uabimicrobium amorphum]
MWMFGCTSYERPNYKVIQTYDHFELRHYPAHIVAETQVNASFDKAGNKAFRRLAGFISGANSKQQKIAMTAPVNQQASEGETIAMTAPVNQINIAKDKYMIEFIMPQKYTMETIPQPTNPKVKIRQIPAKIMAVRKYKGSWSQVKYNKNKEMLLTNVQQAKLEANGNPIFARYNSPFTIWFLRENEVLVEIKNAAR